MAIEIDYSGEAIMVGAAREIFQAPSVKISGWDFSPTPEGERLLVISGGEVDSTDMLELFVNWPVRLTSP